MEPARMVMMVFVVIILIVAIYSLWKWLYGDSDEQDMIIYSSPSNGLPGSSSKTKRYSGSVNVPQIYAGGQYSISTWIYITNWNINKTKNKVFLKLSGGGDDFQTLVMYLGTTINKLGVRVSTEGDTVTGNQRLNAAEMTKLKNATNPYSDASTDFKMCDIESVDLQRWVNITAVLSGKTIDIYMDGKLARSCVLPGIVSVDGDVPTLILGDISPGGFGGIIGKTRAANFAYSPDRIYANYQEGPFSSFSLSSLNPGNYGLTITSGGSQIFSTNTGN